MTQSTTITLTLDSIDAQDLLSSGLDRLWSLTDRELYFLAYDYAHMLLQFIPAVEPKHQEDYRDMIQHHIDRILEKDKYLASKHAREAS